MGKQEYTFSSADGKSKIHGVRYMPAGEPVAVLQIVHGMVEYIERYEAFASFLCDKGYAVVGHDHIGHGHSVSSKSELGVMTGKHPSDIMVEDIYTNYKLNKKQFPNIPYYILGHSMGSYMLRKFLCVKAEQLEGIKAAVVMGTGQEAAMTVNAGLAVINIMKLFKGPNYRSKFVQKLTYSAPYKQFDCYGKDYSKSWLSKNIESVDAYYHDEYCTYMFTLNAYKGLVESTKFDRKQSNVDKMRKDMPLLVVSGKDDPVGALGKGTTKAYESFVKAGIKDVTLKLYEGDRHEILNELDREQVYEDIYNWMEK